MRVSSIAAALDGRLDETEVEWDRRTALAAVVAAHGYPDPPRKGDAIRRLPVDSDDRVVVHAGTQRRDGQLVVTGGRVLAVTALGDSVRAARSRAYAAVEQVQFDGMQYRRDIEHCALKPR